MTLHDLNPHANLVERIARRAASFSRNPTPAELLERTRLEPGARATPGGGIAVGTAPHTGRSPSDKFIVRDALLLHDPEEFIDLQ
jgi:ATP-dependent phosphoenolpyruvate carboxykinase